MKRLLSAVACLALGIVLVIPSVAYADETSIYAPFGSFEELYNEYMDAMENGDVERQEWLLDIGESSLDAEIKLSEEALASVPAPMYNPDEMYWINQFPKYFHYGTWKYDSQGRPNLALGPINTGIWLPANTANGWNATYTKFRNDSQWRNENVASMKDCHARPIYSTVAGEWNIEPWKPLIYPITCNIEDMSAVIYNSLIYLGVAFGSVSVALTIAGFIGRKRWPRNRSVFAVVISSAFCSVSVVCIAWSIVMDVHDGDWQSLVDTAFYWAVCCTCMVVFNALVGLVSLVNSARTGM